MFKRTNLHEGKSAEAYLEAFVKRMIVGRLNAATDKASIDALKGMVSGPAQLWTVDSASFAVDARVAAGDAMNVEYFNALHRTANGHHSSSEFLGWHRSYLVEYEKALGVAIPYWDWTVNPQLPDVLRLSNLRDPAKYDSAIYSASEITAAVDYFTKLNRPSNGLDPVAAAAARDFLAQLANHIEDKINNKASDSRRIAASGLSPAEQVLLDDMRKNFPKTPYDWYQNFASIVEGNIEAILNGRRPYVAVTVASSGNFQAHDQVHVEIGGQMGNPVTAAFDPAFWLHHAYVDKIWHDLSETLRQNGVTPTLAQFETGLPSGSFPAPYDSDTYASVSSVSGLGYEYDDAFIRQIFLLVRASLRTLRSRL